MIINSVKVSNGRPLPISVNQIPGHHVGSAPAEMIHVLSLLTCDLLLSTRRRLQAGNLSPPPTDTASRSMTSGSTRRTVCSGRSSARTPPTATRSAAPRSWATAAATRASPTSAPACEASSTRSPSREPTNTSPWTWPATRCPSSWCDGGRGRGVKTRRPQGDLFFLSDLEMFQPSGNKRREERSVVGEVERWLLFLAAMSKTGSESAAPPFHLPLEMF